MEVIRCQMNEMDHLNEGEVDESSPFLEIDWAYEFSAPKYYDFTCEETYSDVLAAEKWFQITIPYENSPHVANTKSISRLLSTANGETRGSKLEALKILAHISPLPKSKCTRKDVDEVSGDCPEEILERTPDHRGFEKIEDCQGVEKLVDFEGDEIMANCEEQTDISHEVPDSHFFHEEPYTPVGRAITGTIENNVNRTPPSALANLLVSPGSLPTKRLYSDVWKETPLAEQGPRSRPKNELSSSSRIRRNKTLNNKKPLMASSSCHSQAEKKRKLDNDRLHQLLYMKDKLPRPKNPPTLTVPHEFQFRIDERSHNHQEKSKNSPFVSLAERVQRFHMKTPERFRSVNNQSGNQVNMQKDTNRKLKLTVAKSPVFGTSQRVRPLIATELQEEEMLAKIPKFKARPLPKKILETPTLPTFTKSIPHVPEFQEFHLHTMDRAQHHASSSTSQSNDTLSSLNVSKPKDLLKPRPPQLVTAHRARPSTFKSREELEAEELAKMPKFKARPLNKMIFECKGDLGVPRNQKREVTTPQEFHFKTDERAHSRAPDSLANQILKLSLTKPNKEATTLRPTVPKPFHLSTDDRGLAKEIREIQERIQKQQEEANARIPIANPLPWTTKFPEVPPKPMRKECTKPEPFYLESLLLHEQEQERLMVERMQAEQLQQALREFHAQPNLSNVPVVLPPKPRIPLTIIEEFNLTADQRAIEREDFDKKVAEKQKQIKINCEKYESSLKAAEEKFVKAMRKKMIPLANPMPSFHHLRLPLRCKSSEEPTTPVSHILKKTGIEER